MADTSPQPIITLDDVHLSLGQGAARVHILKGATLGVEKGMSVGIVGPSGSGKSTLLMVLAGLERPTSGTVKVGDADLTGMTEDQLAAFRGREIGIVFQSFHLIPTMTALENVAVPLELAGQEDPFGRAKAELEAVGLGSRTAHYPTQLSGGEQQRVAVARALAPRPTILVADEPTGNLDGSTGRQIADLLFDAPGTRGTTLILVTHDVALAERCDRMIRIDAGRVVEEEHAEPLREAAE
ncbi:MAG: ABC transporter ATP-binding protein [Pseudomonadota bacterium]